MQILLQDVIDDLPLARGISQAEEPKLWSLLEQLKPAVVGGWILRIIGIHFAAGYEVAKQNITKEDFIPFSMMLMSLPVMMLPTANSGAGKVAFKIDWKHDGRAVSHSRFSWADSCC